MTDPVNPTPALKTDQATHPQPVVPVSGGGKETAPLSATPTSSEWIKPSIPEMQVPQELQKHMEAQPVVPTIPQDVQQMGVTHAKEATPVTTADDSLTINTPPSVLAKIKQTHKNVKDAVRWFAELVGLAQKKRDYQISHPSPDDVPMKGGNE